MCKMGELNLQTFLSCALQIHLLHLIKNPPCHLLIQVSYLRVIVEQDVCKAL